MDDDRVNNSADAHSATSSSSLSRHSAQHGYHQISLEEAEQAAARFKPIWETCGDGLADAPTNDASLAETQTATDPIPSTTPKSAWVNYSPKTALHAESPLESDAMPDQGPVEIIAAIPKRTDIQIKDEPSVVVPIEVPEDAHRPLPTENVRQPCSETKASSGISRAKKTRKPWMMILAFAAPAAILLVVGVAFVSRKPSSEKQQNKTVRAVETSTPSIESLPIVAAEVVSSPTADPKVEKPAAQPQLPTVITNKPEQVVYHQQTGTKNDVDLAEDSPIAEKIPAKQQPPAPHPVAKTVERAPSSATSSRYKKTSKTTTKTPQGQGDIIRVLPY